MYKYSNLCGKFLPSFRLVDKRLVLYTSIVIDLRSGHYVKVGTHHDISCVL